MVAIHPLLEGRRQYRIDPAHRQESARHAARKNGPDIIVARLRDHVARRSLDFWRSPNGWPLWGASHEHACIDSIRKSLVWLRMPRALEALDATLRRIEQGEIDGIQAFDELLMEELTLRKSRRIKAALMMARLTTIKTLAGFEFAFQPSLDRKRIMAPAELKFIERAE